MYFFTDPKYDVSFSQSKTDNTSDDIETVDLLKDRVSSMSYIRMTFLITDKL